MVRLVRSCFIKNAPRFILLGAGMWLTGVHINVISVANLVLAIGLSVDYCSHIAHAYITMPCVDKNGNAVNSVERSINALIHIGPSVVSGGE